MNWIQSGVYRLFVHGKQNAKCRFPPPPSSLLITYHTGCNCCSVSKRLQKKGGTRLQENLIFHTPSTVFFISPVVRKCWRQKRVVNMADIALAILRAEAGGSGGGYGCVWVWMWVWAMGVAEPYQNVDWMRLKLQLLTCLKVRVHSCVAKQTQTGTRGCIASWSCKSWGFNLPTHKSDSWKGASILNAQNVITIHVTTPHKPIVPQVYKLSVAELVALQEQVRDNAIWFLSLVRAGWVRACEYIMNIYFTLARPTRRIINQNICILRYDVCMHA